MKKKAMTFFSLLLTVFVLCGCVPLGNMIAMLEEIEQYEQELAVQLDEELNRLEGELNSITNGDTGNNGYSPTPVDVNAETYYPELSTTHSDRRISFEVVGKSLKLHGSLDESKYGCLLVLFDKDQSDTQKVFVTNGGFNSYVTIPDGTEHLVEVYGGPEEYGNFTSIILDYVKLRNVNGEWKIVGSPVYQNNLSMFNQSKNPGDFLDATDRIQSDDAVISSLARQIVSGCTSDYEKARAVHDWVAENIYYDKDVLASGDYGDPAAKNVLLNKKGVCEGYANLVAALLRSQGVPCRIQTGYALGVDTSKEWNEANVNTQDGNHAWNEVYADGRWILVDATWDSPNNYENGQFVKGEAISDIYFDCTMEFFSLGHRSM